MKNTKEDVPGQTKRKRKNQSNGQQPMTEEVTQESDAQVDELCKFFKQCTLPNDASMIKDRMKNTADLRRQCKITNKAIFDSSLHLYIADPDLVRQ